MIVEVPVTGMLRKSVDKFGTVRIGNRQLVQRMWIDAADLVKIKNPSEITNAEGCVMRPVDYKFDVTAMLVDTQDIFRLHGCWSHSPGEIIADVMAPMLTQEQDIMLDKISRPVVDFPTTGRALDLE